MSKKYFSRFTFNFFMAQKLVKFSFVATEKARLDAFLTTKLNGEFSRVEVQNFIKNGGAKVNEKVIKKCSFEVKNSDQIDIECAPKNRDTKLQAKDIKIDIVFENENLIVINKQAGLSVHPGAGNRENTLVNGLLKLVENGRITLSNERGDERLGIVHRLDKDTSGLMIVAKNNKSHRLLAELIKNHAIDRRYLALCHGVPVPPVGCVQNHICRDKKNIERMKICHENDDGAKLAITHYKVLKVVGGGKYSLVECRLETGRTHQIRLHMQSIKRPLVGEQIYTNSNLKKADAMLGFTRQMLHSYHLKFNDPISGELVEIERRNPEIDDFMNGQ